MLNPLSVEGFISWMERQDPATEYDWTDCSRNDSGGCLGIRYSRELGLPDGYPKLARIKVINGNDIDGTILYPEPWTIGAALARAKATLAEAA